MRRVRTRRLHGMTLPELLVGLALGLVVTAGCVAVWAAQLREERSQLAETRLTQDLRSALDLIARDLRRAGYWGDAARLAPNVPAPGAPVAPTANPYASLALPVGATDSIGYAYSLDATENGTVDSREQFGLRLRAGAVDMQLGNGNWQALTDPAVSTVTRFEVRPTLRTVDLASQCPQACDPSLADCPRQQIRSIDLRLEGRLVTDPQVTRQLQTRVMLRNHLLQGTCTP